MKSYNVKYQTAFTLIELMIVIGIIGILTTVAVPSYRSYTLKATMTEGLVTMNSIAKMLTEQYSVTGVWPKNDSKFEHSLSTFNTAKFTYHVGSHSQPGGDSNVWFIYNNSGQPYIAAFLHGSEISDDVISWDCKISAATAAKDHGRYLPTQCTKL